MLKKPKAPPPTVEVIGYDVGTLRVKGSKPLPMGSQEVTLKLEGEPDQVATINVETFLEAQGAYWASLESPAEYTAALERVFPPAIEELEAVDNTPRWEEKRAIPRLGMVLGMMSPDVKGFKCVSHDITTVGIRMATDNEFPEGKNIKFRLELDDHRIPPLEMKGQVIWSKARQDRGFWVGVRYTDLSDEHRETIDKFIEDTRNVEHGVITRDYAD